MMDRFFLLYLFLLHLYMSTSIITTDNMNYIAVIGAGTMGNGIAHTFAQYGYDVALVDTNIQALEAGIRTIENNLKRQLAKDIIKSHQKDEILSRISGFQDLKKGVENADLVVEAITENKDTKLAVFAELDRICKEETILATNTSSISVTELAAATNRKEQVVGMHFMNPVPVMKLVEIIRGYSTSDEVLDLIMQTSKNLKKSPVEVNDYPGFVANRILMPMINEAIYSLYESVAGVEEIDTVMKLGMAHPMGPLQLADFIGLDVCLSILQVLNDGFGNPKYAPCPLLINMVTAGKLGIKSGEGFYSYAAGSKELKVSPNFS